ncbi:TetR family transcriptional regulator [Aureimonas endophytica]|uniref:TetR family transcriptional regulator n=1 Tax=Aureimonas endophytica TaxID=2027858 RepID=A0A916ZZP6_9HYPH|nr:SAM-dependent methyltransferase [Aureimonas endophytica]GGE19133.1 TetR family transcriptional regulator [Aureimonas endophytica]
MTSLGRRIAALVRAEGPITIERFWNLALFDPEDGYYMRRDPFGRGGDFTTAPEISQMFGELVGAWLLAAWRALGAPSPFVLAEIGPGRGTLMADMLRVLRRLDPSILKAARVTLVETSDRLARVQAERLAGFDLPLRHRKRIEEIEALPLLLVGNELFDAVAIRQFVMTEDGWRERLVGLEADRPAFTTGAPEPAATRLLQRLGPAPAGTVFEVSPARLAIAEAIGARLARDGGAALLIDYGHAAPGFGDTLQAVRRHAFADPLAEPGEADITSHVDFAALAARLARPGLHVAPIMPQGAFLLSLGLRERAIALARAAATEDERDAVLAAAHRLAGTGPNAMGELFKVLVAASRPLPLPPFPAEHAGSGD